MRIHRLIVHNFTSLRHVDLDFTDVPPGIVGIVGPFGAGKSTLLEAPYAAVYRVLPSRDLWDLKEFATAKDTAIEEYFRLGINAYHARVSIDGVTGKSEAVLECDGVVLNDGKVSTFDQVVRQRFPSREVMLAAAIATQNKQGNFVSKKPKEKAELFTELLGLTGYLRMSQTAKELAERVEATRTGLVLARDAVARLADAEPPEAEVQAVDQRIATATTTQQTVRAEIARLEAQFDRLANGLRAHAAATQRLQAVVTELVARETERAVIDHDLETLRTRSSEERLAARRRAADEKAASAANRDQILADTDRRIANNRHVQEQAAAIRTAVATLQDLARKEQALRLAIDDRRRQQDLVTVAHRDAERTAVGLQAKAAELARARADVLVLARVPFGQRCAEAGCEFVSKAAASQAAIAGLEAAVASTDTVAHHIDELTATYREHAAALAAMTKDTTALRTEADRHAALAKQADALAAAEARIVELETAKAAAVAATDARALEIEKELHRTLSDIDTREHETAQALALRAAALERRIQALTADRTAAEKERDATRDVQREAVVVESALVDARRSAERAAGEIASASAAREGLLDRQGAARRAAVQRMGLELKIAHLGQELIQWRTLQDALGREGVPMLEIDAAGPLISQMTNELLAAAFGPRFSVDLVTQQAKADGGMKDAFDLLVIDNERGGETRKIGQLSGGEQVIVSEALMNALAIYVNQHSGLRLETIWRDETVGALNPEARGQYFQMLRKVQAIGGYHHIFIVTHDQDIAALCDALIRVDKDTGTAAIALPPYADAA